MNIYIMLASLVGLPLFLALLLRVSAVLLFVGVAAGALLAQYIADDTSVVLNSFFTHTNSDAYVGLGLLLFPVVLTLIFLRKTLSAPQLIFHLIPLIVTSAAFATLVLSSLPGGVHSMLVDNPIGKAAESSQDILLSISAFLTLLLAWLTMGHKGRRKHH